MALTLVSYPANISNSGAFNITTSLAEDATHVNLRVRGDITVSAVVVASVEKPKGLADFDFADILKSNVSGISFARDSGVLYKISGGSPLVAYTVLFTEVWETAAGVTTTGDTDPALSTIYKYVPAKGDGTAFTNYVLTGTGSKFANLTLRNNITKFYTAVPCELWLVFFTEVANLELFYSKDGGAYDHATHFSPTSGWGVIIVNIGELMASVISNLRIYISVAPPVNAAFTQGAGTLAAGTYYYRVTALVAGGETTPSAETSLEITINQGVNVNWGAITGATGYKIYGRSTGAELLIATVGEVTTYLDDGSITPSGAMPTTGAPISEVLTIYIDTLAIDARVVLEYEGLVGGKEYLAFEGLKSQEFTTVREYYTAANKNRKGISFIGINRQNLETRFNDINNASYLKSLLISDTVKKLEASYATATDVTIVSDSVRIASSGMFTNQIDIEYEY